MSTLLLSAVLGARGKTSVASNKSTKKQIRLILIESNIQVNQGLSLTVNLVHVLFNSTAY